MPAGRLTPSPAGTRGSERRHGVMGLRRSSPRGLNFHAARSALVPPPADPPIGLEPLDPSPAEASFGDDQRRPQALRRHAHEDGPWRRDDSRPNQHHLRATLYRAVDTYGNAHSRQPPSPRR